MYVLNIHADHQTEDPTSLILAGRKITFHAVRTSGNVHCSESSIVNLAGKCLSCL
jgi:hypothetical protein